MSSSSAAGADRSDGMSLKFQNQNVQPIGYFIGSLVTHGHHQGTPWESSGEKTRQETDRMGMQRPHRIQQHHAHAVGSEQWPFWSGVAAM